MFEFKFFIKRDYWLVSNRFIDADDGSFFSFSSVEACGGNGNFFSSYPVDLFVESDCGSICFHSLIKDCPGRSSNWPMHVENSICQTDAFVTK